MTRWMWEPILLISYQSIYIDIYFQTQRFKISACWGFFNWPERKHYQWKEHSFAFSLIIDSNFRLNTNKKHLFFFVFPTFLYLSGFEHLMAPGKVVLSRAGLNPWGVGKKCDHSLFNSRKSTGNFTLVILHTASWLILQQAGKSARVTSSPVIPCIPCFVEDNSGTTRIRTTTHWQICCWCPWHWNNKAVQSAETRAAPVADLRQVQPCYCFVMTLTVQVWWTDKHLVPPLEKQKITVRRI